MNAAFFSFGTEAHNCCNDRRKQRDPETGCEGDQQEFAHVSKSRAVRKRSRRAEYFGATTFAMGGPGRGQCPVR
jgi:hypothetical protein